MSYRLFKEYAKDAGIQYSSESIISTLVAGALVGYAIWIKIDEYFEKKDKESQAKSAQAIDEIKKLIDRNLLDDKYIASRGLKDRPIPAGNILPLMTRDCKASGDIIGQFEQGVANFGKLVNVMKTSVEPMAKAMFEVDAKINALAKGKHRWDEKTAEAIDAVLSKELKRLASFKPDLHVVANAAPWYLPNVKIVIDDIYTVSKETVAPVCDQHVNPLTAEQIKRLAIAVKKGLDLLGQYQSMTCSRSFRAHHDDGEPARDFYDSTTYMDDYYRLTEDAPRPEVGVSEVAGHFLHALRAAMQYIEKSLK